MKQRSYKINEQGSDGEEVSTTASSRHCVEAAMRNNRRCSKLHIRSRIAEEQRVHDNGVEMRNTKQDGDEDSFESTEVLSEEGNRISQRIFGRSVMEHLPRSTSRRGEQEVKQQEARVRTTNERFRVAEVTKIGTCKIDHEVVKVTRSNTSESQQEVQPRNSTEDKVVTTSEQSTVESHTKAFHAGSSYQAAGLEQQSDQSTCEIQPSMSREQSSFESKQWECKTDEISTSEAENVDDSQAVSEVA